ncbi:zona pellucida sperm-binding protein 3 isoform 1-T1 [Syngnathus typhle]
MTAKHLSTSFCALLLFSLGCCKTGTDGSTSAVWRTKPGTPKPKPDPTHVSKPTRVLPTVKNTGFGLTNLPDVSVTCSASNLLVRVKPSFYGFSADESELQLGPTCRSNGILRPYGDLLFNYPLTACGSRQELQRDFIVYKFTLHYEPSTGRFPSGASRIDVDIQCRYQRYGHVYQLAVKPTWTSAVVRKTLRANPNEFQIHFMDDLWSTPIKNQVFQLGQQVNVQVSAPHLPTGRKLYISSCHASPDSGSSSSHKYTIIGNLGCMLDSKRDPEGASQFISRVHGTLRFSFKAFQFIFDPESEISLHCQLFATSKEPGPAQKSCTYKEDRWKALLGEDSICKCCDSQCVSSKSRRTRMEGSVRSGLMVSDQPLVAEEGFLRVRRLNNPVRDVLRDDITWQNEDVLEIDGKEEKDSKQNYGKESVIVGEKMRHDTIALQSQKPEERSSREFTEDGSGDTLEGRDAKLVFQEDQIKAVKIKPILAARVTLQSDAPQLDSKVEENWNRLNGTEETTRTKSSDVHDELANNQEPTWYFTWT